jgi:hypothetical protein
MEVMTATLRRSSLAGRAWWGFGDCSRLVRVYGQKLKHSVTNREQAKWKFGVRRPNDHAGYQMDIKRMKANNKDVTGI